MAYQREVAETDDQGCETKEDSPTGNICSALVTVFRALVTIHRALLKILRAILKIHALLKIHLALLKIHRRECTPAYYT